MKLVIYTPNSCSVGFLILAVELYWPLLKLWTLHLYTAAPVTLNMDLEDDTTVLTTLKSFNSFISRTTPPQRLSENSAGSGNLQSQYKRSMEVHRNLQRQQ